MLLKLFLALSLISDVHSDTLKLPIRNGIVDTSQKIVGLHEKMDLEIYPTGNPEVYSCSGGKLILVDHKFEYRGIVTILKDSLLFTYILDSIYIKQGDIVNVGQPIGRLESTIDKKSPLIFMISKSMRQPIEAKKFLVYQ